MYYQQESQAAVAQGVAQALGVSAVQQSAAFPNADVTVVLGADYAADALPAPGSLRRCFRDVEF